MFHQKHIQKLFIDINSFIVSEIINVYVSLCAAFQIAFKRKAVLQIRYVCMLLNLSQQYARVFGRKPLSQKNCLSQTTLLSVGKERGEEY